MKKIWVCMLLAGWQSFGAAPALLDELHHDTSQPLAQMAGNRARQAASAARVDANSRPPATGSGLSVGVGFDGIPSDGAAAPDTSGAAGDKQFVQFVNFEFAVFDKATGAIIQGPLPGTTPWSGFGGPCEAGNPTKNSEPIAQYDKAAGRWVLAYPVLVAPYTYCVAISTTNDATGTYYRYSFELPAEDVPDAPKLAVWPDAYYVSFNLLHDGSSTAGLAVAYDRTNMLAGNTAEPAISFRVASQTNLLPSDFDGTVAPASGEPNFYMNVGSASLNLFKFHADFAHPANSTFTGPTPLAIKSRPGYCSRAPGHCGNAVVLQPSPGGLLDAFPDQLMYRLAWRNVGGVEHLVANQTVIALLSNSPLASLRWYDITDPNSMPAVSQQGSVSDPLSGFWMASIAQDKNGDIALGFSASSLLLFPSIEFTGRLSSDPAGHMSSPQFIVQGSGVQLTNFLWGAYSAMTIDPDDCTFWYTTEYIRTTGIAKWSTRIASLRFPSCQ